MDYSQVNSEATSQATAAMAGPMGMVFGIVLLVISIVSLVAAWRIFTKAGQPGWAAIIPFYNLYILLKIIQKPVWWIILFLIPYVNIVMAFLMGVGLAKAFGKSAVFGIFLIAIIPIGPFIIAFDNSKYLYGKGASVPQKPAEETPPTPPTPAPAA